MLNVLVMLMLIWGVKYLARLAYVNPRKLGLVILVLCLVGAYSSANNWYFVWLALAFGVFGLVCARCRIPTIPMILGMVMGDTLEANLRQTLAVSEGSFMPFVTRPLAAWMLGLTLLIACWPLIQTLLDRLWPGKPQPEKAS